ncbi:hypothetical protein PVAP13_7NG059500 [Panicum virgatum]|uniref:Uncharacterized protein n=1 Tax=Panicum virgatum TaxID=38727 RepID=A0A8T0PUF9_PANVG|nr:hypothetical protein PVAP13_7NG059500 [Panicum virgatum]
MKNWRAAALRRAARRVARSLAPASLEAHGSNLVALEAVRGRRRSPVQHPPRCCGRQLSTLLYPVSSGSHGPRPLPQPPNGGMRAPGRSGGTGRSGSELHVATAGGGGGHGAGMAMECRGRRRDKTTELDDPCCNHIFQVF